MNTLVRNERRKLTATAFNNLALAFVVTGVIGPLVSSSFGLSSAPALNLGASFTSVTWLLIGAGLHYLARWTLRRLEP